MAASQREPSKSEIITPQEPQSRMARAGAKNPLSKVLFSRELCSVVSAFVSTFLITRWEKQTRI